MRQRIEKYKVSCVHSLTMMDDHTRLYIFDGANRVLVRGVNAEYAEVAKDIAEADKEDYIIIRDDGSYEIVDKEKAGE